MYQYTGIGAPIAKSLSLSLVFLLTFCSFSIERNVHLGTARDFPGPSRSLDPEIVSLAGYLAQVELYMVLRVPDGTSWCCCKARTHNITAFAGIDPLLNSYDSH